MNYFCSAFRVWNALCLADVAELVDALDLGSSIFDVGVRFPPSVQERNSERFSSLFLSLRPLPNGCTCVLFHVYYRAGGGGTEGGGVEALDGGGAYAVAA